MLGVPDVQLVQVLLLQQLEGVQVLVAIEQEGGEVLLGEGAGSTRPEEWSPNQSSLYIFIYAILTKVSQHTLRAYCPGMGSMPILTLTLTLKDDIFYHQVHSHLVTLALLMPCSNG